MVTINDNRLDTDKVVVLKGSSYDDDGFLHDHSAMQFFVRADGTLWEEFNDRPFARVSKCADDTLSVAGGTFAPAEGELARLSVEHGCAL